MMSAGWVVGYAVRAEFVSEGTWRDTRLGGLPVWPPGPHPDVPHCPSCGQKRLLVAQAFAPHAVHSERILLLFGCNSAVCARKPETWTALRAFLPSQKERPEKTPVENVENVTTTNPINWDSDSAESQSSEEGSRDCLDDLLAIRNLHVSQKNAEASLPVGKQASSREPSVRKKPPVPPSQSNAQNVLKPHFVEVDVDSKQAPMADDSDRIGKLLQAYISEEASASKSGESAQWDPELADESEAAEAVESFRQAVERAPKQVLRYKFGGDPVWPIFPAPEAQHSVCPHCGGRQVFELQLLGSVLFFLKPEDIVPGCQDEAAMNFMALGIYTCEKDCESGGPGGGGTNEKVFEFRTQEVRLQHDVW